MELKKILESKAGIKVEKQRLIYMAKALLDTQKLCDFIKENGQTIHLIESQEQQQQRQSEQQETRPDAQERQNVFGQLSSFITGIFGQAPVSSQIIVEGPEITYQRFEMPLYSVHHHAPAEPSTIPQVNFLTTNRLVYHMNV